MSNAMPDTKEAKHQQPQDIPKRPMLGGIATLTVTTALLAGCVILAIRKQSTTGSAINSSVTAVSFQRFSLDWWRHQLSTMIRPSSVSTTELMQLLQQQQQEAAAAATTSIVNATVQTAIRQFQTELQKQLVHDRHQSTIQFLNTIQQHERALTKTLGQPIYSTNQQMSVLQEQIQTLQQVFLSPKSRGTFGEVQLELLIKDVLPATMYTMQYTLSNKKRVDCMLHLPLPIGNISIDSKFPTLTTTTTIAATTTTATTSTAAAFSNSATGEPLTMLPSISPSPQPPPAPQQQQQQQLRKKEIRDKVQKHINDIASKYIIPGETSPHAICFIPSVSLFLDIVTDNSDLLLYAHRQNVWLTCPTTLLAVLTSIQGISRGQVVAQQTTNIFALITKLNKDIDLLVTRFEMAEKAVEKTRTELGKMQTSVHKIQKVKMELDALSQTVSSSPSPVLTPLKSLPNKGRIDKEHDSSNDNENSMDNDDTISMDVSELTFEHSELMMSESDVHDVNGDIHASPNGDIHASPNMEDVRPTAATSAHGGEGTLNGDGHTKTNQSMSIV